MNDAIQVHEPQSGDDVALVVLDATDTVAGQFATRLLADHGADVTLVEPIDGSPLRRGGPVSSRTGRSLLFTHLNGGKRSVVVSEAERSGPDWWSWCDRADLVVVSRTATANELIANTDRPLVAAVTEFGSHGPYRSWRGSEIVHQALSGSMYVTGTADREPLFGVGDRASYAAGLHVHNAAVACLAGGGDAGRLIEVDVHEAAASMEQNFSTQWAYNRTSPRRDSKERPRGRAQCRDGWVVYFLRQNEWETYADAFQAPELLSDERFSTWSGIAGRFAEVEAELDRAASKFDVAELVARADARKMVLAPMLRGDQLRHEPHLTERSFWRTLPDGDVALGPVIRFGDTPVMRDRPAPELGTHIGVPRAATRPPTSPPRPAMGSGRPLTGIRVLEITSAWAGPMAGRMLAHLGADVIKVEGPQRYDAWRGERSDPALTINYPHLVPGERPYDRHLFFNTQNHDKRSLVLDLKSPRRAEVLGQLLPTVDVVIANWSPGALGRVGLAYDDICDLNPDVVMVEMPAMGLDGPLASQRGLGPTMEAMAGIANLIGYDDGRPLGSGTAYLDPVGALHGVAAVTTALLHRRRTGRGQFVEVAQREAAMHWIGDRLLDSIVNGGSSGAVGNDVAYAAPHGAYPTCGEDSWLAIDVRTDDEFSALASALGASELAHDPRFTDMRSRSEHRRELDEVIGRRTERHDARRLADVLQGIGVRAAPVVDGRNLFADPQLRSSDWFVELDHRAAGRQEYPGLPARFDGVRRHPVNASPILGEHTVELLVELGFDEERIEEMLDEGSVYDAERSAHPAQGQAVPPRRSA